MSEPRQLLGPGLLSFCRNSLQRTVIGSPRLLGTLEYGFILILASKYNNFVEILCQKYDISQNM